MVQISRSGFNKALVAGALLTAFSGSVWAQPVKIAIANFGDHPQLNESVEGFKKELTRQGFIEGKDVVYELSHTNFDSTLLPQMIAKLQAGKPKLMLTITTPVSQVAKKALQGSGIPIVFSVVTDPVAAKLVKDWQPSGTNVTGVSDALPLAAQMDLLLKVKPGAKRVGYVYSPGEVNSTIVLKDLKAELQKRGMTVAEAAAPRTVDIPSAAKSLVGKVDVIYTNTDNNVVSAYESMVRVAQEAKLPLVAADTDSVKRGATAALGMNYYDLGRQTGKIVDRILKGTKPGEIAPEVGAKMSLMVNPGAAEKQGITLPESLIKEAADVVK